MLGLGALGQLALGELPANATNETTQESKYHVPWSEPVRNTRAWAAIALIASGMAPFGRAAPFPETVTVSRWLLPLSEPVRIKPALPAFEQHVFESWNVPVVSFGWNYGWTDPVRVKPALPASQQHVFEAPPRIVVSFGWFNWFADPVRIKPALPAFEQHVFEFEPDAPEPGMEVPWFANLSEPVRVKPALPAFEQHVFEAPPRIVVSFGWNYGWTDPVRVKPGLTASLQHYTELNKLFFELPLVGGTDRRKRRHPFRPVWDTPPPVESLVAEHPGPPPQPAFRLPPANLVAPDAQHAPVALPPSFDHLVANAQSPLETQRQIREAHDRQDMVDALAILTQLGRG